MEFDYTDWPELAAEGQSVNSVEVLVYVKATDEHFVAWFNYNSLTWQTQAGPLPAKRFKWRYLTDFDKY